MAQKGYFKQLNKGIVYPGQKIVVPKLTASELKDVECGMLVLQPGFCKRCEGKGKHEHPDWQEFYKCWERYPLPKQMREAKKFWKKKGKTSQKTWPPQEIECENCKGNEVVYAWGIFDLQTLLIAWTNVINREGKKGKDEHI